MKKRIAGCFNVVLGAGLLLSGFAFYTTLPRSAPRLPAPPPTVQARRHPKNYNTMFNSIMVSGAGTPSASGAYPLSGGYYGPGNTNPFFSNGTCFQFFDYGNGRWCISTSTSTSGALYYIAGTAASGPNGAVAQAGGSLPLPSVYPILTESPNVAPVFESAVFIAGQSTLYVTLTERDSPPLQPASGVTGWSVIVNGVARAISSASAGGKVVSLVLVSPVASGDAVQVSYAASSGNVTDSANNAMADFPAQNAVVASAAPFQLMVPSGGRVQGGVVRAPALSGGKVQGSAGKIYLNPMPTRTDIGAPQRPPVGQLTP